ncbi:MAG: hypothetical protein WCD16_14860 [Paracoccaceae bacterium]
MFDRIRQNLVRFAADESASLIAEAVIILPLLAWWWVASLVFFQAYDARNINMKAAYTISDMLSREDGGVDSSYIEGLGDVYAYLTAGQGVNSAIRVTLVRCDDNCDKDDATRVLHKDWSYGTNGKDALDDSDLPNYLTQVPMMPQGDRVIMVETFIDYTPPFNVGLTVDNFRNFVVTRPRFVPVICFDGVTCTTS